jgi:2-hydroxycyclohexanecarboxyl-CoA dehydrogenase
MTARGVAMVTGAARGIGRAIAARLCAAELDVALCDVDATAAVEAARALASASVRTLAVPLDVSDGKAVRAAMARISSELGPVGVLVNNAGIDRIEPFVESREETWDRLIAVNLKGTILCCRAALDPMIERGAGCIVNIGSDAGRVGSTGEAVYSATKGGVIAFSKTLAREVARHGIRVNCVCPGPTDTALLAQVGAYSQKLYEGLARAIPMRRIGEPDEIAAVVAFLASDDARYVTGQTLSVDGGLTMI